MSKRSKVTFKSQYGKTTFLKKENKPNILQDVWKILYATETFSMVGLKRKDEHDKIYAQGFDSCIEHIREELDKLEKSYES